MRKAFAFLAMILLLTACGDDNITGSVVNADRGDSGNDGQPDDSMGAITGMAVNEAPSAKPLSLRERLKQVYAERAEVMLKKRELLTQINTAETFEERQAYQKALDMVRQRESELTLSVRILEARLAREERIEEAREMLPVYRQRLEEVEGDISQAMERLSSLGREILLLRQELRGADYEEYLSIRKDLNPLEEEEISLLKKLERLREEKDEFQEKLDYVESGELIDTEEDLLIERQKVVESLGFVRNGMMEQYFAMNKGTPEEQEKAEMLLDDLRLQEEKLQDELRELDAKIEELYEE